MDLRFRNEQHDDLSLQTLAWSLRIVQYVFAGYKADGRCFVLARSHDRSRNAGFATNAGSREDHRSVKNTCTVTDTDSMKDASVRRIQVPELTPPRAVSRSGEDDYPVKIKL
jgi:hypothetical protein